MLFMIDYILFARDSVFSLLASVHLLLQHSKVLVSISVIFSLNKDVYNVYHANATGEEHNIGQFEYLS